MCTIYGRMFTTQIWQPVCNDFTVNQGHFDILLIVITQSLSRMHSHLDLVSPSWFTNYHNWGRPSATRFLAYESFISNILAWLIIHSECLGAFLRALARLGSASNLELTLKDFTFAGPSSFTPTLFLHWTELVPLTCATVVKRSSENGKTNPDDSVERYKAQVLWIFSIRIHLLVGLIQTLICIFIVLTSLQPAWVSNLMTVKSSQWRIPNDTCVVMWSFWKQNASKSVA
jgi:hypothetical protein